MLLLVILGAVIVGNEHYHQLLGNSMKHVGGGLVFTGLMYAFPAGLGYYSARTQNKFLLLVVSSILTWRLAHLLVNQRTHSLFVPHSNSCCSRCCSSSRRSLAASR